MFRNCFFLTVCWSSDTLLWFYAPSIGNCSITMYKSFTVEIQMTGVQNGLSNFTSFTLT